MSRIVQRIIRRRRVRLLVQTLAVALLIAGLAIAAAQSSIGTRIEERTIDARFAERGRLAAPSDVVVVAIDRTQSTNANRWPLSRETWAAAIDQLGAEGVAGIAIDVPMDWAPLYPSEDVVFASALSSAKVPVVLARREPNGDALSGLGASGRAALDGASVVSGISARTPAADGAVRTYPVHDADGTPTGLAAALVAAGGARGAVRAAPATMLLNQYGPRATFEHVSFTDFTMGIDTQHDLRGKLVVIGPTEGIARDDHDVPMGGSMSSAEIQATAVANLLDGSWLQAPSVWVEAAATVAIVVAIWALLLTLPLGLAVPGSIALLLGWSWLAVDLFEQGLVLPLLAPVGAGALTFMAISLVLVVLSVRERVRVKGLFARYVHADVVQELLDGEDQIDLGGEEREITVLFSDIRGFTSMSERVDPVEMVAQLNEYFEAMVEIVAAEHGAVDKFLGDGLMAIFGAPVRMEDHALHACRAATAMLERLDGVNAGRAERGLAPLRIGIGIHTGRAVVGNVGSPPFRVDFTAIGDTVNLAARLEAQTKELGATIVASEGTRDAVQAFAGCEPADSLAFEPLGTVVARGRTEPTRVFSVTEAAASGDVEYTRASA